MSRPPRRSTTATMWASDGQAVAGRRRRRRRNARVRFTCPPPNSGSGSGHVEPAELGASASSWRHARVALKPCHRPRPDRRRASLGDGGVARRADGRGARRGGRRTVGTSPSTWRTSRWDEACWSQRGRRPAGAATPARTAAPPRPAAGHWRAHGSRCAPHHDHGARDLGLHGAPLVSEQSALGHGKRPLRTRVVTLLAQDDRCRVRVVHADAFPAGA